MTTYLDIDNVSKIYDSTGGAFTAVDALSLQIAQSEFVSILGPSGCGKSTLLKCVAGLEAPSSGQIRIKGQAMNGPPQKMGIVFQRDALADWRTVLQNVMLVAEFRGKKRRDVEPRARELLEKFGLERFVDKFPWELSGGMRQRASICRALLDDPELLLMDEPFGALDAMTRDQLNIELQSIWSETKKTVMFITHGISEAVFLSDRVVVMSRNPGRVVEVMSINLPRPRKLIMRESPEFVKCVSQIQSLFMSLGVLNEH